MNLLVRNRRKRFYSQMGESPVRRWWCVVEGVSENPVGFSLNEYMCVNIWCMLDWIIGFCHKTVEIHFLGISCSTFSPFTFHLENSSLSAHVKPSLENNSSNLLISNGVVIKITVYIYSAKFSFIKVLFSVCIIV